LDTKYLSKIILHIIIGVLLFYIDIFPRLFFFSVIIYFLIKLIFVPNNEKTTTVLKACAYLVGAEVIFRMTEAGLFYESSKYFVIFFILFGIYYNGISNRAYPYFIFLIFLIPSIIVASISVFIYTKY